MPLSPAMLAEYQPQSFVAISTGGFVQVIRHCERQRRAGSMRGDDAQIARNEAEPGADVEPENIHGAPNCQQNASAVISNRAGVSE